MVYPRLRIESRRCAKLLIQAQVFWACASNITAQIRNSSIDCTVGSCGTQQVSADGSESTIAFGSVLPNGITTTPDGLVYLTSPATRQALALDSFTFVTNEILGINQYAASIDGPSSEARFQSPSGVSQLSGVTFIADTLNFCIRTIDSGTGLVNTLNVGTPGWPPERLGGDGIGSSAQFDRPVAISTSSVGNKLYVADGNRIRQVDLDTGALSTIAGSGSAGYVDGYGANAELSRPMGLALSDARGSLFVAEFDGHRVRMVNISSGRVSTLAGSFWAPGEADGVGSFARFESPAGLAITPDDSEVLVVDFATATLRGIDIESGQTRTLSRTGAGPTALLVTTDAIPYIVVSREGGVERILPRCRSGYYRERNGECYACTAGCAANQTVITACNGIDDITCA